MKQFFRFFKVLTVLAIFVTAGSPLFLPTTSPAHAAEGLPATYSDFKARCQSACTSPEGAVKMYFDAVFCYLDPARRAEAAKMLRFILHAKPNWERSPNYNIFSQRLQDPSHHYIFRSFAEGTSPENNYHMSPDNYRLALTSTKQQTEDFVLINLLSTGADNPRLVTLKRYEDGLWYIFSNAGTYAQVRPPRQQAIDTSHDADYDSAPVKSAYPAR